MSKSAFTFSDKKRVEGLDLGAIADGAKYFVLNDCGKVFEMSTGSNYADTPYTAGGRDCYLPALVDVDEGWNITIIGVDTFHHAVTASALYKNTADKWYGGVTLMEHEATNVGALSNTYYAQLPADNAAGALTLVSGSPGSYANFTRVGLPGSKVRIVAGTDYWLVSGIVAISGAVPTTNADESGYYDVSV